MDFPILCQKCGNKVWYNMAFIYFNLSRNSGNFGKEFNFIRRELGLIPEYKPLQKQDNL